MSFRVLARVRDDGDFEPIAAFSTDLQELLSLPISDWVCDIHEYLQATHSDENIIDIELENVESVMSEQLLNES
jgi:hypothetical protein